MLLATGKGAVIYPVMVVHVDGIKWWVLLDTGAALIKRLGKQASRMEHKRIDMMMCWTNQKIYQYDVKVSSIVGDFNMAASVSKVDRSVLLTIPNPRYADKIHQYPPPAGSSHEWRGRSQSYTSIWYWVQESTPGLSLTQRHRLEKLGEPVGELISLGWTMMLAGKEAHMGSIYLSRTSSSDYAQLCSLDVLSLQDRPDGDQQLVYNDFKEQSSAVTKDGMK